MKVYEHTNTHNVTLSYTTIHNPVALQSAAASYNKSWQSLLVACVFPYENGKHFYYKRPSKTSNIWFWYLLNKKQKHNRNNFFSKKKQRNTNKFGATTTTEIFAAKK